MGMILLPGEERRYFSRLDWAELVSVEQVYTPETVRQRFGSQNMYLLRCQGSCPREERPLACRVFPLAPILTAQGVIRLVLDDDGIEVCPLVQHRRLHCLTNSFVRRVRFAFQTLVQDEQIREWTARESERRIQMAQDPWLAIGRI